MNNTRFATALHILTLLADSPEQWLSSEYIAGSINVNPVVVRKELQHMHRVGLVTSRKGKEGGSQLTKPADQISIQEIYLMVKNTEVLGKKNEDPNPKCPIGRQMNDQLDLLFGEVNDAVMTSLNHKTLSDFAYQFS